MPANVQELIDTVTANNAVVDSAIAWINGSAARTEAAIEQALANGATEEELQPLRAEVALQREKCTAVAEAIAANTPAE